MMMDYKLFERYQAKIFTTKNIHNINKLIEDIEYHINIPSSRLTDDDYQIMSKSEVNELVKNDPKCRIMVFLVYRNQYIITLNTDNSRYDLVHGLKSRKFDYCVVFNLDELYSKHKTKREIRDQRSDNVRKSNEDVRNDNIKKYVSLLLNKFDYSTKEASLLSTKKIFNSLISSSMIKMDNSNIIPYLRDYSSIYLRLIRYIDDNNEYQIKCALESIRECLSVVYRENLKIIKYGDNIERHLKDRPELLKMWHSLKEFDILFAEHFRDTEIVTVDDIHTQVIKLQNIREDLHYTSHGSQILGIITSFTPIGYLTNKNMIEHQITRLKDRSDVNIDDYGKVVSTRLNQTLTFG